MEEYYDNPHEMQRPPLPHLIDPESEKIDSVILENEKIIDELVRTLRGQIIDSTDNTIKETGCPLVEERAVAWLVSRFVPYVSKIFSLSYLDEENIKTIIFEFESELICELIQPENLGIPLQNRDMIKNLMTHTLVSTLWKAYKGETLAKLLVQYHVSEATMKSEQQRGGFFKKRLTEVGDNVRV